MLTNCWVGDFSRLLFDTRAQQGNLRRRFMEMENANMRLLAVYSSTLERHEALTRYIQQQNPTVRNALKDISGRLDNIVALIDGSHV